MAGFSFFTDKLMLEHREHKTEKRLTGVKTAELIKSGGSVILDSGSVLTGLVKRIIGRKISA
jgi:DeoR/GlpR family transcriptional regulator of sugar metabolism